MKTQSLLYKSSKHGSAAAKMCLAVIALVSYMALGLRAGGNLAAACWATRPWEGEVKAVENQWREVESTTESPAQVDGSDNMEPIHTAATYGNADALGRELAKNVSPDLVCANGFVPLDYVVSGAIGRGSNNRVASKLRARPPQRHRRDLRPEILPPPPAGASPPRRRVRVPRGRLLITRLVKATIPKRGALEAAGARFEESARKNPW